MLRGLLLGWLAVVVVGCVAPRQRHDVDPAAYRAAPEPPACITRAMEARYAHCPDERVLEPAAACTPAAPEPAVEDLPEDEGEAFALLSERIRLDPERACLHRGWLVDLRRRSTDPYFADEAKLFDDLSAMLDEVRRLRPHDPKRASCGAGTARRVEQVAWELRARALVAPRPDVALSTATTARAANLFTDLRSVFASAELRRYGVCTPAFELAMARADLTRRLHEWQACAEAFDDAVALGGAHAPLKDAAYGAVLCHQRAYANVDDQVRELRPLLRMEAQLVHADGWRSLLGAYRRYLCIAGDEATSEPYADLALARADVFLQGGALWEAAVGFRELAYQHGSSPIGFEALSRYADLIDTMGATEVCTPQLRDDLVALLAGYCGDAERSPSCRALRAKLMRLQGFRN